MNDWLPVVFTGLMGLSMLLYVVLDGYDLGVGMLLRQADDAQKDTMIASIGPFWDANETWLVLGVGFALDDAAPVMPTLDVILSQTSTPLTPKEADFLAAANQEGGGESDQAKRPRDSQAGWIPQPDTGLAPQPLRAQTTAPAPPPESRVVTTRESDTRAPVAEARPQPDQPELPQGEQKVQRDAEMARLAAEYHLRSELYAKRPKRKCVAGSGKECVYGNYVRAGGDRAERVGNLNYPDEARRRRIGGLVVISVAVRRDGSLENIRIAPKDESKTFIEQWAPGRTITDHVVSATIEATKPQPTATTSCG